MYTSIILKLVTLYENQCCAVAQQLLVCLKKTGNLVLLGYFTTILVAHLDTHVINEKFVAVNVSVVKLRFKVQDSRLKILQMGKKL